MAAAPSQSAIREKDLATQLRTTTHPGALRVREQVAVVVSQSVIGEIGLVSDVHRRSDFH